MSSRDDFSAGRIRAAGTGLLLLALAVYAVALPAPFLFDDGLAITDNPTIRSLWPLWEPLRPPAGSSGVTGRPMANLSLALNYVLTGAAPLGFRLTNVLLHGATALLLFGLLRRTLRGEGAQVWAWTIAAIWTVHPLATESVSCIIQRTEVLSGCFYLATLYAFRRASDAAGAGQRWLGLAVAACAAGMASKETVVTAPVAVLLYDRAFLAGSFSAAWKLRRGFYLALAATWLLLAVLVAGHGGTRSGTAGWGGEVAMIDYLLTQAGAIVLYLRLVLWPHPLVVDYGTAVVTNPGDVWREGLLVLALLGAAIGTLIRRPQPGFVAAGFFLLLAPSSSFVPLATQTVAEHRMYLPLACVIVLAAVGLRTLHPRGWWIGVTLLLPLAAFTITRNRTYLSPAELWRQNVAAVPENPRARVQLGNALAFAGDHSAALREYREALRLRPRYAVALHNAGNVCLLGGRLLEARSFLQEAMEIDPDDASIHNSLAIALNDLGRRTEALTHYRTALSLAPEFAEAHHNLGLLLLDLQQFDEAIAHFRQAVQLKPDYREPRRQLEILGERLEPTPSRH